MDSQSMKTILPLHAFKKSDSESPTDGEHLELLSLCVDFPFPSKSLLDLFNLYLWVEATN